MVNEFIIPAQTAKAFEVEKGQTFRIHQVSGGQVGDCVFYNAHDYREFFHVGQSWAINVICGTGTSKTFKHFYLSTPNDWKPVSS